MTFDAAPQDSDGAQAEKDKDLRPLEIALKRTAKAKAKKEGDDTNQALSGSQQNATLSGNHILHDDLPADGKKVARLVADYLVTQLSEIHRICHRAMNHTDASLSVDSLAVPGAPLWKSCPWKKIYTQLPQYGVQGINWPEGLRFPLHPDVKDSDAKLHQSVHTLNALDLHLLVSAVRDPDYPFHFKVYDGNPAGALYFCSSLYIITHLRS